MLPALLIAATLSAASASPMEAGLRVRPMKLPNSWLDPWLVAESPAGFSRPEVGALAWGGEFSLDGPQVRWTFYLERAGVNIDEGYWDDDDDDPSDGHWVRPEGALGLVSVGANVGKQWPLTDQANDVWLGLVLDGGLGLGVFTGQLTRWTAGSARSSDPVADDTCGPNETADQRYTHCGDDGEEPIPPVVPLIDLNLGLNVNITEHAYLRIEGGLHTFVFGGVAAGARF